jgi:hypothetical protein
LDGDRQNALVLGAGHEEAVLPQNERHLSYVKHHDQTFPPLDLPLHLEKGMLVCRYIA